MSRVYVVAGQTEPISIQLFSDARPVDLTGATATLVLRDKTGTLVDTSAGVITILDAPAGKLRYSPAASLFEATLSPYVARWRVIDPVSQVGFWPNREADQWVVGS
jgi:BppU N-terminal domain